MNNANLPDALARFAVVACVILVTIYALIQQSSLMLIGILAFFPIVMFINRPQMFVVAIIGLSNSLLLVPGLPRGLLLMHLLMIAFIGVMIARYAITKPARQQMPLSMRLVLMLMAWLVVLIQIRGLGLRTSSDGMIGGAAYIRFFLFGGFLIFSRYFTLTARQWKISIIMMVAGSFLPVAAEQLFIQSKGTITIQYLFIEPYVSGLMETLMSVGSDTAVSRLTAFTGAASSILMAALVFTTRGGKFRLTTYLLIGLCLLLAGLSGFRSLVFEIFMITVLFRLFIAPRAQRISLSIGILAIAAAGLLVIYLTISHLPLSIQRALSWIPFAEIDILARMASTQSTEWRLRLWQFAWDQAGPFFWIGRGFAVSVMEASAFRMDSSDLLHYWNTHLYHSGPLSAWIDLGLPGFILLVLFFAIAIRDVAFYKTEPANDIIYRFQTFIRVELIFSIISYIFIFGDVRSSITAIILNLAIFYSLDATNRAAPRKTTDAAPPKSARNAFAAP